MREILIVSNNRVVFDILSRLKKKRKKGNLFTKTGLKLGAPNTWRGAEILKKKTKLTQSTFHPIMSISQCSGVGRLLKQLVYIALLILFARGVRARYSRSELDPRNIRMRIHLAKNDHRSKNRGAEMRPQTSISPRLKSALRFFPPQPSTDRIYQKSKYVNVNRSKKEKASSRNLEISSPLTLRTRSQEEG